MYCAADDIEGYVPRARLVELTDDAEPGTGEINAAIIGKAIGDSSATIDAFIGGRHTLPLAVVPPIIKKICIDLSIYNLFARHADSEEFKGACKRHDNAMKLLQMIADGTVALGIAEAEGKPGFFARSHVEGGPAQFTMDSMRGL